MTSEDRGDSEAIKARIRARGSALGFDAVAFAGVDLAAAEAGLVAWLEAGFHGSRDYMARHGMARARPAELVPGTLSVISARINYLAADPDSVVARLAQPGAASVSVYAHGRDYHKVLRGRLLALAEALQGEIGAFGYRVFTDSAPVMEVALAEQGGLGWRGKHTLLLSREAGSFFFLGEIYTDLPLVPDPPQEEHCGTCFACRDACPTGAIVGPYRLDARRCISYLTIELKDAIPPELRPLIGNRIYGCDDCQLACPWNKFARAASEPDFAQARNGLDRAHLADLFAWSETEFNTRMAGSAIRRIGYAKWLSNIAIGLGNCLRSIEATEDEKAAAQTALAARAGHADPMVRESVDWALDQGPAT